MKISTLLWCTRAARIERDYQRALYLEALQARHRNRITEDNLWRMIERRKRQLELFERVAYQRVMELGI